MAAARGRLVALDAERNLVQPLDGDARVGERDQRVQRPDRAHVRQRRRQDAARRVGARSVQQDLLAPQPPLLGQPLGDLGNALVAHRDDHRVRQVEAYIAAILAFGLNSGAYISEIIRAGILAVDRGQLEASMALGIPYSKMMKDIILPQAVKNILPALVNEFITLTKESAIVTVIGIMDIMRRSYIVGGNTYRYFESLLFAGLVYYIMVVVLTMLGKLIEKRMSRSD